MPYIRKKIVVKKKRVYKRRGYKKRSYVPKVIPWENNIGVLAPPKKTVTLVYNTMIPLSCTSGIVAANFFRLNSLYDPDYSGSGSRPYGSNIYDTLYNQYFVNSCKINVKYTQSATNNQTHACGLFLDSDTQGITDLNTRLERTHGRLVRYLTPSITEQKSVTYTWNAKKFYKQKDPVADLDNCGDTGGTGVGSNPVTGAYLHLWVQPIDESTTSAVAINCMVTLEYKLTFLNPKELAGS